MLNGLLRIALAGLIALGIVAYVTDGDLDQVGGALNTAVSQAATRKDDRISAKNSTPEEAAGANEQTISVRRCSVSAESR